jgi:hypothetical protein
VNLLISTQGTRGERSLSTRRLAIVVLLLSARAVEAGPWCFGDFGWAPAPAHEAPVIDLPVRPHVVFFHEDQMFASKRLKRPPITIVATIDGKRVGVAEREVQSGPFRIIHVEVLSDAAGTLELGASYDWGTHGSGEGPTRKTTSQQYRIVRDWKAPKQRIAMSRYTRTWGFDYARAYHGIAIGSGLPAASYLVRWRRDEHDDWRTVELPPQWLFADGLPDTQRAFVGQATCGNEPVSLALMKQGIEIQMSAQLPDGKLVPIHVPKRIEWPLRGAR